MKVALICTFLFLLIFIHSSCDDKLTTIMQGWWTMDSLYIDNYEALTCLTSNSIYFEDEDSVTLPVALDRCLPYYSINKGGRWEFLFSDTAPPRLAIRTDNEFFNDTFRFEFYKDEKNGLFKMKLASSQHYMVIRKGLFAYYSKPNQKLMDYIIEKTR